MSARLVMLVGFEYLKLPRFVRGSGQPRTNARLWVWAEVRLSSPNSVNACVVRSPKHHFVPSPLQSRHVIVLSPLHLSHSTLPTPSQSLHLTLPEKQLEQLSPPEPKHELHLSFPDP